MLYTYPLLIDTYIFKFRNKLINIIYMCTFKKNKYSLNNFDLVDVLNNVSLAFSKIPSKTSINYV